MPEPFSATAPIKSLSGTATNPGVSFTGDEDTGLYRSGANELAVTVGGAEAAKFTATGMEIDGDISLDDGGTYTTTLQTITPTAARTISFPDATGTVALVGGSSGNLVVNQSGAYAGVANSSVDNATGNITLGSRFISTVASASSAPAAYISGTWFAGTSSNALPALYVSPAGTSVGTSWATAGTAIGVNAPAAFAGNLLDLQVNGTHKFKIQSNGVAVAESFQVSTGTGYGLYWTASTTFNNRADGVLTISNYAENDFGRLQFGGTTTSFPALKRNSAVLETKLADDSAYARHAASVFQAATAHTVATLPGTPAVGMIARVTDATAPAMGSTVAGGGAAAALCWYNGANWSVIGV